MSAAGDDWTGADIFALLELEGRVNAGRPPAVRGWQLYRADTDRWGRNQFIPTGHFWAGHWDRDEPLIIAATMEELETKVRARQDEMAQDPSDGEWPDHGNGLLRAMVEDSDGAMVELAPGVFSESTLPTEPRRSYFPRDLRRIH